MRRLIKFPLDDAQFILVEVEEIDPQESQVRASPGKLMKESSAKFAEVIGTIKPVAENIITTLSDIEETPDQITVELAFKFTAEGTLLATLGAEANCKVNLSWKK